MRTVLISLLLAASSVWALSPVESKNLLREYLDAQKSELRAVEHQQRFDLKELKASQDANLKEFEKAEREARYKFFEAHTKGPERRDYIQAFIKRRDTMRKGFIEERANRARSHEGRIKAIKDEQALKLKNFKISLEKGEKPPVDLWPSAGR